MRVKSIPARGGSKRIPRKNIRQFGDKPMIAHSLTVAKASGLFEHVLVSTEDEEIAGVARQCGAEVPFKRPVDSPTIMRTQPKLLLMRSDGCGPMVGRWMQSAVSTRRRLFC